MSGPAQLGQPLQGPDQLAPGPGASLAVADLDGDGRLDIVASRGVPHQAGGLEIYYGQGDGSLVAKVIESSAFYGGLAIGDIDGDGCLDLAVALEATTQRPTVGGVHIYLARREGQGCVMSQSFSDERRFNANELGANLALGDFDHDGKLDLALTRASKGMREPLHQILCFNDAREVGQVDFKCEETGAKLGGVLAAAFADLDGDGFVDLVFGGVNARLGGQKLPNAWALVLRGQGSRQIAQELVLLHRCEGKCKVAEIPHLVDLEIIPRRDQPPQIAAAFSHHLCEGRKRCLARAAASVFELERFPASTDIAAARQLWTSAGSCNGFISGVEAASLGPVLGPPELLFGYFDGRSSPQPGGLVIVPSRGSSWAPASEWRHALGAGDFSSYALAAADLDGSHTKCREFEFEFEFDAGQGDRRLVPLERPLHWIPRVQCAGQPVQGFSYAIESSFLTLAQPCAGPVRVAVCEEAGADILYIPALEHRARPIQILRSQTTD